MSYTFYVAGIGREHRPANGIRWAALLSQWAAFFYLRPTMHAGFPSVLFAIRISNG